MAFERIKKSIQENPLASLGIGSILFLSSAALWDHQSREGIRDSVGGAESAEVSPLRVDQPQARESSRGQCPQESFSPGLLAEMLTRPDLSNIDRSTLPTINSIQVDKDSFPSFPDYDEKELLFQYLKAVQAHGGTPSPLTEDYMLMGNDLGCERPSFLEPMPWQERWEFINGSSEGNSRIPGEWEVTLQFTIRDRVLVVHPSPLVIDDAFRQRLPECHQAMRAEYGERALARWELTNYDPCPEEETL